MACTVSAHDDLYTGSGGQKELRIQKEKRERVTKWVDILTEQRWYMPAILPSFSKYQVFSFSSSFSTLLSFAVWISKNICGYWEQTKELLWLLTTPNENGAYSD